MDEFSNLTGKITLGSWEFNVIDISDKNMYYDYIRKTEYPANLWTSNFAFLWSVSQGKNRKLLWKVVDDMLVTFTYLRSGVLYLPCLPFGPGSPDKVVDVLYKCLSYCLTLDNNEKSDAVIKVANSMQLEFLRKSDNFDELFRVIGLVGLEKHFSIEKLLTLPGKDFETVRRKINKFIRLNPTAIVREYKPEDYEKVMELSKYWSETSGEKYSHIFDDLYFYEIVNHYKELDHMILVVEVGDKIIGMVSGGDLPTGESWWCFSKFMNEYDGLSDFLIVELAKAIHKVNPNIKLMNAAEDLGPGGLRFFKERFRPVLDLRRCVIKLI